MHPFALPKQERISSRKTIERLFGGGHSKSMSAFPLRMVYMLEPLDDDSTPQAQMMVSVPKRCFKRAVRRNRAKRQVREAYRHAKPKLLSYMAEALPGKSVKMAFIWLDANEHDTARVAERLENLLQRLQEKLSAMAQAPAKAAEQPLP